MDEHVRREFVQRATEFLEANANRRVAKTDDFVWGEGPTTSVSWGPDDPGTRTSGWRPRRPGGRGRSTPASPGPAGPVEHGGGGLDPELDHLYRELEADFDVPDQSAWAVAWDMVGPAVHGPRQRRPQAAVPAARSTAASCCARSCSVSRRRVRTSPG